MAFLAMIDRGYRGSLEAQYFDALYGVLTFRAQLGSIDVVLRGSAVTAAVDAAAPVPALRLGSRTVDTMPDPRAAVARMIADGIDVYVEERGLARFGLDREKLLPGARAVDTTTLATRWADYEAVWFL